MRYVLVGSTLLTVVFLILYWIGVVPFWLFLASQIVLFGFNTVVFLARGRPGYKVATLQVDGHLGKYAYVSDWESMPNAGIFVGKSFGGEGRFRLLNAAGFSPPKIFMVGLPPISPEYEARLLLGDQVLEFKMSKRLGEFVSDKTARTFELYYADIDLSDGDSFWTGSIVYDVPMQRRRFRSRRLMPRVKFDWSPGSLIPQPQSA